VPGDTSLFLPQTLEALLQSRANIVQPENKHVNGFPVLLDRTAMGLIRNAPSEEHARNAASQIQMESVRVEDAGILLRGRDMTHRKNMIRYHNSQLARPVTEITLSGGCPLYDPRLSMLLHLVEQTRSVREACSLMQISYSTAWNLLNRVEDELGFPLVVRIRGGSAGSGSVLTEKGRGLMVAYDRFSEHLNREANRLYGDYFDAFTE
jgi:molybdate transport repressor ModE-like protein